MWSDLASTRDAQGTLQCLGFLVEQLAKFAIALRTKAIVGHCHELTIVSRPVAKIDAGDLWDPCPSDLPLALEAQPQGTILLRPTTNIGEWFPARVVLAIIDTPPLGGV